MNFEIARHNMVTQQVRSWDVINKRILNAMLHIQREEFVQVSQRKLAFADMSLPLGYDQNMMKPVVEGRMLQCLNLQPKHKVLEIGTGSGYVTALLSTLCQQVTSIELIESLSHSAKTKIHEQGIKNATLLTADFFDFDNSTKYDRIVITGSIDHLPSFVFDWLNSEGLVFAIVGDAPIMEARTYTYMHQFTSHFDTVVKPLINKTKNSTFEL